MIWWALYRLKSGNPGTRLAAARKLGESGSRRAVPALLRTLNDDNPAVRIAAAKALALIPHAAAVEPLASAISRAAGTKLGKTDTGHDEFKALAEAIAAQGKEATQPLARLLASTYHSSRFWAAWALGRIGGHDAAHALAAVLDDRRSEVRQQAAASLGKIADPAFADALVSTLSHRDPDTRRAAAEALGSFNEERVLQALENATKDADEGVQCAAVTGLARIGTVAAALRLRAAVESSRKSVREAAVSAVKLPSLKPCDAKEAAALAAVRADYLAAAAEGEVALPVLLDAMQSKNADRRAGAAHALGRLRSLDAIPSLVSAMRDPTIVVRESAEGALVSLGHVAVAALIEALSHEDMAVQRHAAAALGRIGDHRAITALAGTIFQNRRSPSGYDGPVEAARSAAEALKMILRRKAAALSEEELRRLCDVPDAVVESRSTEDPLVTIDATAVDCAPVRALAHEELSRRLGWAW